jgi:hypothetical protein
MSSSSVGRLGAAIVVATLLASCGPRDRVGDPESRAIAYLAQQVPGWPKENGCFSCHNNGDAARALFIARRRGWDVPDEALTETLSWLQSPDRWDGDQGNDKYQDLRLARLQFAAALRSALDAGVKAKSETVVSAAVAVSAEQRTDGSWRVEPEGTVGSPTTYGPVLATHIARTVLSGLRHDRVTAALSKAESYLKSHEVYTVLDAASMVLAVQGDLAIETTTLRERCFEIIEKAQSQDGGWGPFATSPPEVFDTALVVLALAPYHEESRWRDVLGRGRRFLLAHQQPDGGWIETTRPSGAESYAMHISTTAWALMALVATAPGR